MLVVPPKVAMVLRMSLLVAWVLWVPVVPPKGVRMDLLGVGVLIQEFLRARHHHVACYPGAWWWMQVVAARMPGLLEAEVLQVQAEPPVLHMDLLEEQVL